MKLVAKESGLHSPRWWVLALALPACSAAPPPRVEIPAPPPPAEDTQICLDMIEQRGITLCRGPVDEATARHLELSYRLHRRKGLPWRIDRVNGWGRLVEDRDGTASTEISYGVLPPVQETARDAKGRIRFRVRYSEHLVRTDVTSAEGRPVIGLEGTFPTNLRAFDERGFVAQTRYFDPLGDPTWDQQDRAFGLRITRNQRGFVVATEALGKHTETLVAGATGSGPASWIRAAFQPPVAAASPASSGSSAITAKSWSMAISGERPTGRCDPGVRDGALPLRRARAKDRASLLPRRRHSSARSTRGLGPASGL